MSQREVMSGLRSVKRDFSSNSISQSNQNRSSGPSSSQSASQKLSAMEERMRRIQQGLNEHEAQKASLSRTSSSQISTSSSSSNTLKRSAENQPDASNKRRQLPSSWKGSTSSSKPGPVKLSKEQTHILKLVEQNQSVFYTGSAGTGKSVLLREIIKTLKQTHAKSPDAIAVTASTGNPPHTHIVNPLLIANLA